MAKLRDYFFMDLSTFMNTDEFADEANIDGKNITIVIDNDLLKEHNLKNGGEGLAVGELLFHAKKIDFEEELFIEKSLRFNNSLYRISDLQEDESMYTVTLVGYRS